MEQPVFSLVGSKRFATEVVHALEAGRRKSEVPACVEMRFASFHDAALEATFIQARSDLCIQHLSTRQLGSTRAQRSHVGPRAVYGAGAQPATCPDGSPDVFCWPVLLVCRSGVAAVA